MLDEEFYIESKLKGFMEINVDEYAVGKNNFDIDLLNFLFRFDVLVTPKDGLNIGDDYSQFRLSIPIRAMFKSGPKFELTYVSVNKDLIKKISY